MKTSTNENNAINDDWRDGFFEVRVYANIPVEFTMTVKAKDEGDAVKAAHNLLEKMTAEEVLAEDVFKDDLDYSEGFDVIGIEESHGFENTPEDLIQANLCAWNVEDQS